MNKIISNKPEIIVTLLIIAYIVFSFIASGCSTIPLTSEEIANFDREIQRQNDRNQNYLPDPRGIK